MFSNQQIQNNWPKIKSHVLSHWSELSDLEVEKTHGHSDSLEKLVHEKYGENVKFDREYEKICNLYAPNLTGAKHYEMDMAVSSMDKDRDDHYLTGECCVTRPINEDTSPTSEGKNGGQERFYESALDGFNNADRHSADYSGLNSKIGIKQNTKIKYESDELTTNQVPSSKDMDITLRRSNSSANTTSHSALSSSEALSRDTKKL